MYHQYCYLHTQMLRSSQHSIQKTSCHFLFELSAVEFTQSTVQQRPAHSEQQGKTHFIEIYSQIELLWNTHNNDASRRDSSPWWAATTSGCRRRGNGGGKSLGRCCHPTIRSSTHLTSKSLSTSSTLTPQIAQFRTIEMLQEHGIAANDVEKLKSAGYHTVESVSRFDDDSSIFLQVLTKISFSTI